MTTKLSKRAEETLARIRAIRLEQSCGTIGRLVSLHADLNRLWSESSEDDFREHPLLYSLALKALSDRMKEIIDSITKGGT